MSSTDGNLDDCVEEDDFEIIAEGLASSVSKTWASVDNGEPQLLAIKTSTTVKKWAKEPHDIIKECRLLRGLSHPNIIQVFDFLMDGSQSTMNIWMPYIPYSLPDLLDLEAFTPKIPHLSTFLFITRSLMTQILDALVYLHAHQIAHRDLKPANVLLTPTGRVVIIDFGIAWDGSENQSARNGDLWPEGKDKMYFEVSTGPYRSPELLFGTRSYDAYAIDLWSLGTLFAEFFTELAPISSADLEYAPSSKTRYFRTSLFDASRGEIGLAWSIFRILGTPREPNNETEDRKSWAWPGFQDLPDAQKVEFTQVDGVGLDERIFPNLPAGEGTSSVYVSPESISGGSSSDKTCHLTNDSAVVAYTSTTADADVAVDLIRSLLRYLPARRIKAKDALEHAFLSPAGLFGEILIPHEMYLDSKATGKLITIEQNGARRTLGELLLGML